VPTWKLTVEYDGLEFCGWQIQPNGPTVQAALEEALQKLHSGDFIRATAAGRTDAGVHARGQVVSFSTARELVPNAYERGLNTLLPRSCAVRGVEHVSDDFDARRWSHGKRYVYRVLRSRFRSPLRERYTWMVHQKLDVEAIRQAASLLTGKLDFASFQGANCDAKTTIRHVKRLEVLEEEEELVFRVEGTAFLKHMVRNVVGTLVEVGIGSRSAESMRKLISARDRTQAGRTAPPQGLCLDEVFYDLAAGPPTREAVTDADD
jgi:tRNA pseudouridine38-40 synthase